MLQITRKRLANTRRYSAPAVSVGFSGRLQLVVALDKNYGFKIPTRVRPSSPAEHNHHGEAVARHLASAPQAQPSFRPA